MKAFIIAEAGVNHNGSLDAALRMVEAAKNAGADAVKFQTFKADRLATAGAKKPTGRLCGTLSRTEKDENVVKKAIMAILIGILLLNVFHGRDPSENLCNR